jgi:hypothetical protein
MIRTKNIDTNDLVLAGAVTVDSGQIMLGDPCYLDEWKSEYDNFDEHKNKKGEYSYLGACNATLGEEGYGELGTGAAVVVSSGYGDGYYPVYVKLNEDNRISMAFIDFDNVIDVTKDDEDEE